MMNSGEPITGIDRRPLNRAGMDIGQAILQELDDGTKCQTSCDEGNLCSVMYCVFTLPRRDRHPGEYLSRERRSPGMNFQRGRRLTAADRD
jgi:hypothetical protein